MYTKDREVVFIAGPIRDIKQANKKKFDKIAKKMTKLGWIVLNPASLPYQISDNQFLHVTSSMIDIADVIFFVDDWKMSETAIIHHKEAIRKNKEIQYQRHSILF